MPYTVHGSAGKLADLVPKMGEGVNSGKSQVNCKLTLINSGLGAFVGAVQVGSSVTCLSLTHHPYNLFVCLFEVEAELGAAHCPDGLFIVFVPNMQASESIICFFVGCIC